VPQIQQVPPDIIVCYKLIYLLTYLHKVADLETLWFPVK